MIEIKLQFTDVAQAVAFITAGEKAVSRVELKQDLAELQRVALDVAAHSLQQAPLTGEANSAGTASVSNPSPEAVQAATQEAPKAEGKRGPGRPPKAAKEPDSAAPAEVASAAKQPEPASTPAPAPAVESPKTRTYEETDFPKRIMQIVADQKATGNTVRVDALKAALSGLGLKSARELKPEQLDGFGEKLAEIEAMPLGEEALG